MSRRSPLRRAAQGATLFWGLSLTGCTALVDGELDDKPTREARAAANDAGSDLTVDGATRDAASSTTDGALAPASNGDGGPGAGEPGGGGNPFADASIAGSADGGGVGTGALPLSLCVGVSHACGLLPSGRVTCWGDDGNDDGQTTLQSDNPTVRFVDLACGDYHTCGVTSEGSVLCVGRNRDGQRQAPSAVDHHDYVQVTAGDVQTCARKSNGTVDCWGGSGSIAYAQPPGDAFKTISAGAGMVCGIHALDGSLACWGGSTQNQDSPLSDHDLKSLDIGEYAGCAIDKDDLVKCWGWGSDSVPVLSNALSVSVGGSANGNRACALLTGGRAVCWISAQVSMQPGPYRALAVGAAATCYLPNEGNLSCSSSEDPDPIRSRAPQPYPPP